MSRRIRREDAEAEDLELLQHVDFLAGVLVETLERQGYDDMTIQGIVMDCISTASHMSIDAIMQIGATYTASVMWRRMGLPD